jgi:DNA-binding response OmpR family regulator
MNNFILIVDDDPDTRNIIKTILSSKGYQTKEAKDGPEALSIVESEIPALILLDIMMPEMSGYEVVTRLKLKTTTQSIPIIMLTAKGEDEDILAGYNEFAVDYYITKPFTPKHLINGIELILGPNESDK